MSENERQDPAEANRLDTAVETSDQPAAPVPAESEGVDASPKTFEQADTPESSETPDES